jgi:hypothetical protein
LALGLYSCGTVFGGNDNTRRLEDVQNPLDPD